MNTFLPLRICEGIGAAGGSVVAASDKVPAAKPIAKAKEKVHNLNVLKRISSPFRLVVPALSRGTSHVRAFLM